jgi:hypothetical protein
MVHPVVRLGETESCSSRYETWKEDKYRFCVHCEEA